MSIKVETSQSQPSSLVRLLVDRAERLARRGRWADARALFAAAMTADFSAAARIAFGAFLADCEQEEEAVQQLELAWEEARVRQSPEARAICCQNLSAIYRRQGNHTLASQFQQLAVAAEMDSERFQADASLSCSVLTCTAAQLSDCDEHETAIALLRAATETSDGDEASLATIEANLGFALARLGFTGRALQQFVKAHRLHRDAGDLFGCAHDLLNIGHLLQSRARRIEAQRCFRLAAELLTRTGANTRAKMADQFAQEAWRMEAIESCDPLRN